MTHTYALTGMHCQSCVKKITEALNSIKGVTSAKVTLNPPRAEVQMVDHVPTEQLARAVAAAGDYQLTETAEPPAAAITADASTSAHDEPDAPPESLYPLFLIVGYIAGTTALIAVATENWSLNALMNHFMAGFFLVFSFFKLLDLRGFADAYRSYDVLARKIPAWGFVYPFVELGLGILYLLALVPFATNIFTLVLMLLGSIGVLKTLLDKRAIRCACLGTALKLPMTKVTLVEDLGMAAMAAVMLVLPLFSHSH